ncbi:hypothetical protein [Enterovirga aerilata]|uniref:Uncharacterized protein n=1 Tax=Enterovirga aerilata TaxID=2730920 RepID=A0A849IHB6_9HYPH|nr:hypothetical protein [Enterovirga sp. DB1703]NNM73313.1 hypothetical protein [Enterovirga sp. DB1703]
MAGTGDADSRRAVQVIDGEVRDESWHQLGLGPVLASLPKVPGSAPVVPAGPAAGAVRSLPGAGEGERVLRIPGAVRRVPVSAFVSIGRRASSPVPSHRAGRQVSGRSANDNAPAGERRSVWRDLFFLAVLFATVAGAFWSGRVHGLQKVIVVPGPSSFYSVVT